MEKITFLFAFMFGFLGILTAQERSIPPNPKYPVAYYNAESFAVGETLEKTTLANGFKSDFSQELPNTATVYSPRPGGTSALIFDNGPHYNVAGNPNFSRLEDVSLLSNTYGFSAMHTDFFVADDFTLTDEMIIESFDFYSYQTGGPSNSINAVYVQIWDGDPSTGTATVIWGDRTTNVFDDVVSSGAYRDLESNPGDLSREIQLVTAKTTNLILNAGTYWVEYSFGGIGSSGPWAPPISILGATVTGNGMQYNVATNAWTGLPDGGHNGAQGLPFQINGEPAAFPGIYCGPLEFPTDVEPITRVIIGSIDNSSSEVLNGTPEHEDFTAISSLLEEGESYPIAFEGNTNGNNTNRFVVFVDWNQNGILDDVGEVYEITDLLDNSTGVDGKQAVGTIAVPMGAKTGNTRMRVKKIFGNTDYLDPCLGTGRGQAEDYTIEVVKAGFFPPSNDLCEDAIAISCGSLVFGKTKNATTDFGTPVCGMVLATSPGVWYVLDDNSNSPGNITVSLCSNDTNFNTKLSIYVGDCSNLVCVDSNDDFCDDQSEVTFASDGNTVYYILVHGFDGQTGDFGLTVTCDAIVGTPDNSIEGFSFYPSPSSGVVTLESERIIEKVALFNMLGQNVFETQVNSLSINMDVSSLAKGTYLMQVAVDGQNGVYRIVKK